MKLFSQLFITLSTIATASFAMGDGPIETQRWGGGYGGADQKLVLDYHDQHLRGSNTLKLKQKIRQMYGRSFMKNYDILKVRVVAKSKHGGGTAQLKIGQWTSNPKRLYGSPSDFHNNRPRTYDRVVFENNSWRNEGGVWQVKLQGNIKVKKVVVFLQEKWGRGGQLQSAIIDCGRSGRRGARGSDSCFVDGNIQKVQLINDHSRRRAQCVKHSTFGFDRDGLWTSNGCVGTFKVFYKSGRRGRY